MALKEELEKHGEWLFKWRSYLPLLILPVVLIALKDFEYLERIYGDTINDLWQVFCLTVSLLGLSIRCITCGYVPKETSGRNTKRQKAGSLNTTGMYSIVRHPLYLGNFIIMLGISLFIQVWWLALISVLAFWLYYERIIIAEEEFLRRKFGGSYLEWSEKTPAFLPKFRNWQKPDLPFSFKSIIAREYTTLFVIIASFSLIDITGDIFIEGKLDLAWIMVFAAGFMLYLTLRTLKKKTRILYVEGR
ncbi:MAG: isoprenylcysteine carboxylmethyltransferase family protein [Nitrospirae bacterium]|nr:isoprenylcysteine carboxylmethyltransferase family protein [Nitrospirota bacterium]MDA8340551.1 isoprenylcysteine carboxylmethyltransferase family protein [Nitrospiraceae bacterium]